MTVESYPLDSVREFGRLSNENLDPVSMLSNASKQPIFLQQRSIYVDILVARRNAYRGVATDVRSLCNEGLNAHF